MIAVCSLCAVQYNPDLSSHKTGTDCVPILFEELRRIHDELKKLHLLFQDHANLEQGREEQVLAALAESTKNTASAHTRVTELARRVTTLEHPQMTKVPAMAAGKKGS